MTNLTVSVDDWSLVGEAPSDGNLDFSIASPVLNGITSEVLTTKSWTLKLNNQGEGESELPVLPLGNALIITSRVTGFPGKWYVTVPDIPTVTLVDLLVNYLVDPSTFLPSVSPQAAWTVALSAETNRAILAEGLAAQKTANLSDLEDVAEARNNLGLGDASLLTQAQLNAKFITVIQAPAPSGGDDTAALQAVLDAVPAGGARVVLRPGSYSAPNGGLVCNNPVRLEGAGPGSSASPPTIPAPYWINGMTEIVTTNGATPLLTLNSSGSSVENLSMLCNAVPSAGGAGILVNQAGAGNGNRYTNVSINGFEKGIDHQQGSEWWIDKCLIYNFGDIGIHVRMLGNPDAGDWSLTNSLIYGGSTNNNPTAGLLIGSGGGGRITGNKFNYRGAAAAYQAYCILLSIDDNDVSTGELYIVGNGISSAAVAAICLTTNGTVAGSWGGVVITGNDITSQSNGGEVLINPSATGKIVATTITGNVFKHYSTAVKAIQLVNATGVSIAGNTYFGAGVGTGAQLSVDAATRAIAIAPGDAAGIGPTADKPPVAVMAPGSAYFDTTVLRAQYAAPNTIGAWLTPRTGRRSDLAYSASMTPDSRSADWFRIPVTNTSAMTINAPSNAPDTFNTQELTLEVYNNSGGAMGAITWASGGGAFAFAGYVWTNPATGKRRFARFEWNKDTWVCTAISPGDY